MALLLLFFVNTLGPRDTRPQAARTLTKTFCENFNICICILSYHKEDTKIEVINSIKCTSFDFFALSKTPVL